MLSFGNQNRVRETKGVIVPFVVKTVQKRKSERETLIFVRERRSQGWRRSDFWVLEQSFKELAAGNSNLVFISSFNWVGKFFLSFSFWSFEWWLEFRIKDLVWVGMLCSWEFQTVQGNLKLGIRIWWCILKLHQLGNPVLALFLCFLCCWGDWNFRVLEWLIWGLCFDVLECFKLIG